MKKLTILFFCLGLGTMPAPIDLHADQPSSSKEKLYGDWIFSRFDVGSHAGKSHISLDVTAEDNKTFLLSMVFYHEDEESWVISYFFNASADKEKGLLLTLPGMDDINMEIADCNAAYCTVAFRKEDSTIMLQTLYYSSKTQPEEKWRLAFFEKGTGKKISIPFSLKGFDKAFDALKQGR